MIYEVRGVQVMLSSDVAKLYHVETRRINEVIKRNINRFPEDFYFLFSYPYCFVRLYIQAIPQFFPSAFAKDLPE